MLINNIII